MTEIQFNIKYRPKIENGEYSVKTRGGNPVRIVCWDRNSNTPICALITRDSGPEDYIWTNKEGRHMKIETDDDLFIIIPDSDSSELDIQGYKKVKENIIGKIREQVKKWMPDDDGEENTHGERTAFNSVLNLLKEIENEA